MTHFRLLVILWLGVPALLGGQTAADKPAKSNTAEPALPVIDDKACPFEGCTFGKWTVNRDVQLFSTWKGGRKPVAVVKKGQAVTGETGVHITFEPDRIEMLRPIAELQVQPGDIILRYMYRGEGFADIWAKGQWKREYDCSFIAEKNGSGCSRNCGAKVVSEGRKEWWVRVRTSEGMVGWAKAEDQFDGMDLLGSNAKGANV